MHQCLLAPLLLLPKHTHTPGGNCKHRLYGSARLHVTPKHNPRFGYPHIEGRTVTGEQQQHRVCDTLNIIVCSQPAGHMGSGEGQMCVGMGGEKESMIREQEQAQMTD